MVHTQANPIILNTLHRLKKLVKTPLKVHHKSHEHTSSASNENPRDIYSRLDTTNEEDTAYFTTKHHEKSKKNDGSNLAA
mmetsp:Transcript_1966/g.4245  ORF Transcript_1966/g.4245 Transcript_1966/m.4245 type:complete len:80 (+) Transcript_1966:1114-1353(+)